MKKTLQLLTLLTLILGIMQTNAQIVYTDIPDGQPDGLDFNGDGINEFTISTEDKLGDYITYYNNTEQGAENNIHAVGDANNAWDTPAFVAQGFTIDASNNWIGQGDAYPNGDYANPPGNNTIIPGTDQYMAVRFNLDPDLEAGDPVYYGWVRVNIDMDGNVTYKDYAYESTPNTPIDAGEMPAASIDDVSFNSINLYPNPCKDVLHIKTDKEEVSSIAIYGINGQLIPTEVNNSTNSIDISNLSKGFYFVRVNNSFIKFIKE